MKRKKFFLLTIQDDRSTAEVLEHLRQVVAAGKKGIEPIITIEPWSKGS